MVSNPVPVIAHVEKIAAKIQTEISEIDNDWCNLIAMKIRASAQSK